LNGKFTINYIVSLIFAIISMKLGTILRRDNYF
jgi:hypothetical protein